jgi:hypothetical protein
MSSKIIVSCTECGTHKSVFPSMVKGNKYGSFCNKDCLGKYRSRVLTKTLAANYKDGSRRDRQYIRVLARWHPFKDSKGYVSLHRLIAEAIYKKFLDPKIYVVHHIDNDPLNNHWDNLEIMTQAEHAKGHIIGRKKDGTFIKRIEK